MGCLARIARGDTLAMVQKWLLDEHEITISLPALSGLKKNHAKAITDMQQKMLDAQAIDAEAIMKRSRALINRKIAKAERDQTQIEELDEQYRDGVISLDELRRKKKGLLDLSIAELTRIGSAMLDQTKTAPLPPDAPALGSGNPGASGLPSPTLEATIQALKEGNTVELQRIIFNGAPKDDKSHSVSPEPTPAS